jgi:hypothetical protein
VAGTDRRKQVIDWRASLAVVVLVASVLSAIAAWRASVAAGMASDLDQQATQQLVRKRQIEAMIEGDIGQDRRLLGVYQGHVKTWRLLQNDAARVRKVDPVLAASLEDEARQELVLARALQSAFVTNIGLGDDTGNVDYDPHYVANVFRTDNSELGTLRPDELARRADTAHGKVTVLVGITVLFIAALFFLTLAQLGRANVQRIFATAGYLAIAIGLVSFVLTEVGTA